MKNKLIFNKFFLIIIIFILCSSITVGAKTLIEAGQLSFSSSHTSNSNVKDALDELYLSDEKLEAAEKECPNGYKCIKNPVSFAEDSWETIQMAIESGTYPYKVGDTKTITLSSHTNDCSSSSGSGSSYKCISNSVSSQTLTIRIANTSSCSSSITSETACGFVIEFVDIIDNYDFNDANSSNVYGSNVGGWPASKLRSYLNTTLYNALPSELRLVITDTKVVSSHGSTSNETNFTSTDKLYLLSPEEIYSNFSSSYDSSKGKSRQLDYYSNLGVSSSNYSSAVKYYDGNKATWWLRSAVSSGDLNFYGVYSSGDWSDYNANTINGVSPAFRIS